MTCAPAPSRSPARPPIGPAALCRELGLWLVAGSIVERVEGDDKLRNTSVLVGPDGELHAAYRKIHLFDVEVGRHGLPRVRRRGARRRGRRRGRRRPAARHGGLLRPALPGAVPDHGGARRARDLAAGGVHRSDRPRALGDPRARSRDREPGLRDRGRPDRQASARPRELRPLDDRRPVGSRCWPRRRTRSASSPPTSTSTPRTQVREKLPSLANRRPDAYRWPQQAALGATP